MHWYYRLDRVTQRKCWYLAEAGQKVRSAPRRTVAQAVEPAEPAPVQPSPQAGEQLAQQTMMQSQASLAERVAASAPQPAPAVQVPDPVGTERKEETVAVPSAPTRTPESVYEKVLPKEPVQQPAVAVVADQPKVTVPADSGTGRYAFAALAAISCIAGAIVLLVRGRRDNTAMPVVDLNRRPPRRQPKPGTQAVGAPSSPARRAPDKQLDERLLAFTQAWRNQAA
jgi:hypothetical protein